MPNIQSALHGGGSSDEEESPTLKTHPGGVGKDEMFYDVNENDDNDQDDMDDDDDDDMIDDDIIDEEA